MNQLECMQMFVEVADQLGFSKAAAALHMSPAKVSTQISNLEKHLGVQLLSRNTRTCALTDDGETYYDHCKRVLSDIAKTEVLLSRSGQAPRGRLQISAPVTLINRLLMPVLGVFRARYPQIELEIVHSERVFDIHQEGFDVMLRMGPLQDSNLIARPLGQCVTVTAAAPSYLARYGEPKNLEDLSNHQCINYIDPQTGRCAPWDFTRGGEVVSVRPPGGLTFDQGESRLAAAVMGLGIYYGMRLNVDRLISEGALKLILKDHEILSPTIFMAYQHHRYLSSRVRAFVDFIVECFPAGKVLGSVTSAASDTLRMHA